MIALGGVNTGLVHDKPPKYIDEIGDEVAAKEVKHNYRYKSPYHGVQNTI